MSTLAFTNCKVLKDGRLNDGLGVAVKNGLIVDVSPEGELRTDDNVDVYDLGGQLLLPGFIDTQVNGGGGVLFNDSTNVSGIRSIAEAHRQFGTTGFLPTLISDELDVVEQALRAVDDAIEEGVPGVLGVHIEGPFLNPERRGVHDSRKLKRLTADTVNTLLPIRNGKTVLTIAPEAVDAGAIWELSKKGFVVCAGHSNASYAQTATALKQGLSGFTHLFNAMSQLGVREPGVVGAALDDPSSWCGVIADGHHVSPVSLRIAYRCKGPDKLMLVSDAMPPVGSLLKQFRLLDSVVDVADGVCLDQNGTLAGTALDMSAAVRNFMKFTGIELPLAVRMASTNPATFLGLGNRTGAIEVGKRADLVVAGDDLQVSMTWIAGALEYETSTISRA